MVAEVCPTVVWSTDVHAIHAMDWLVVVYMYLVELNLLGVYFPLPVSLMNGDYNTDELKCRIKWEVFFWGMTLVYTWL